MSVNPSQQNHNEKLSGSKIEDSQCRYSYNFQLCIIKAVSICLYAVSMAMIEALCLI